MLTAPSLARIEGLAHGFLDRWESSASRGEPKLSELPVCAGAELISMEQVHGARVATVQAPTTGTIPGVDALVTVAAGKALVVRTADCIPALFVAPGARAAAVAHAGWRGLLEGVLAETVKRLRQEAAVPAEAILCALGPAIGSCCYEFPQPLFARFIERGGTACGKAWRDMGGRGYLDIRVLATAQLVSAGLSPPNISLVGGCTFCSPDRFHSYRRDQSCAGRQLSFVLWQGP